MNPEFPYPVRHLKVQLPPATCCVLLWACAPRRQRAAARSARPLLTAPFSPVHRPPPPPPSSPARQGKEVDMQQPPKHRAFERHIRQCSRSQVEQSASPTATGRVCSAFWSPSHARLPLACPARDGSHVSRNASRPTAHRMPAERTVARGQTTERHCSRDAREKARAGKRSPALARRTALSVSRALCLGRVPRAVRGPLSSLAIDWRVPHFR